MAAREEPDLDTVGIPERSVYSSTRIGERGSIRLAIALLDETTLIAIRLVEAVRSDQFARFIYTACRVHATLEGMESISIRGGQVHILDNIDLAVIGPIGALCPVGWPNRATEREVDSIHDHQTASSQGVIAEDLDTWPAKGRVAFSVLSVIDFDDDVSRAIHGSEVQTLSLFPCLIEDVSRSVNIDSTVESPAIKEGRAGVVLGELHLLA